MADTPPAPAPLTEEDEAKLRVAAAAIPDAQGEKWCYVHGYGFSFHTSGDGPPTDATRFVTIARPRRIRALLTTLDATRAELARVERVNAEGDDLYARAMKSKEGDIARVQAWARTLRDERDAARAALERERVQAHAVWRDDLRAALERVEWELYERTNDLTAAQTVKSSCELALMQSERERRDADAAGRALVAALEAIERFLSASRIPDKTRDRERYDAYLQVLHGARAALTLATRWRTGEETE